MLMLGSGSYAMVPPFNQRWCGHPLQLVDGFDDICQVDFIVCSLLVLQTSLAQWRSQWDSINCQMKPLLLTVTAA